MGLKGRNDVWLTPAFVIAALGGWRSFDLDPCAPEHQPWPTAKQTFCEAENGLLRDWEGRVWLNPPYSTRLLEAFMRRMVEHNYGTALIFAKTETNTFFRYVWERASGLLFIKSRLHFCDTLGNLAPHNSGAPSVLVAYGEQDCEILSGQPIEGKFIPLVVPTSWVMRPLNRSWREALIETFGSRTEPISLNEVYEFFSGHEKARRNPNWRAKVRQTLRRARYVNVGPGLWRAA